MISRGRDEGENRTRESLRLQLLRMFGLLPMLRLLLGERAVLHDLPNDVI